MEALRVVPQLLEEHPLSLEMIDEKIISLGRASPLMRGRLEWLKGHPKAILILEIERETSEEATHECEALRERLQKQQIGETQLAITDPQQMAHV